MTFFRLFIAMAGVVWQVSMGPSVVSNPGVGWSCTMIYVEIGKGGSEFSDILQCLDELKLAHSEH